MKTPLPLRPHHGLCLHFFVGKGYSDTFAIQMANISDSLKICPQTPVQLTVGADVICTACPHLQKGRCSSADKVERYDRSVLERCYLKEGQVLSYIQFCEAVQRHLLIPHKREDVCGDCVWNAVCKEVQDKRSL